MLIIAHFSRSLKFGSTFIFQLLLTTFFSSQVPLHLLSFFSSLLSLLLHIFFFEFQAITRNFQMLVLPCLFWRVLVFNQMIIQKLNVEEQPMSYFKNLFILMQYYYWHYLFLYLSLLPLFLYRLRFNYWCLITSLEIIRSFIVSFLLHF